MKITRAGFFGMIGAALGAKATTDRQAIAMVPRKYTMTAMPRRKFPVIDVTTHSATPAWEELKRKDEELQVCLRRHGIVS